MITVYTDKITPCDERLAAARSERVAVALGNFDGMHCGHMSLVRHVTKYAAENGLKSAVWSFDTYAPKNGAAAITTPEKRAEILESCGIDLLFLSDFNEIRDYDCEKFVREILVGSCRAVMACCGFNFSFGKNASGDATELKRLCKRYGCEVVVADEVKSDGITVSSSLIRSSIAEGDVERARSLLNRPFSVKLTVLHGKKIGRTLGFPTVNQEFPPSTVVPKNGVYICRAVVRGKKYPACACVGTRPTLNGQGVNCETHIIGCDEQLYGEQVEIEFYKYLRDEIKFDSLDDLKAEIAENVEQTKEYFKARC